MNARPAELTSPRTTPMARLSGRFGFVGARGRDAVSMTCAEPVIGSLPKAKRSRKDALKSHYLYLAHKPHDKFAEHLRMLRTNLLHITQEKQLKLMTVVSPEKSDGKSTTVINLALSLANNGIRVLLVDANLRNPMLNQIFRNKDPDTGLSDIIMEKAKVSDAITETGYNNLHILYAGEQINYPSELISSKKMVSICRELKKLDYDIILFDNTNLEYSESSLLAGQSDGVIYVIRFDKTKRESAIKGKSSLEKVRANIIGTVVNYCTR